MRDATRRRILIRRTAAVAVLATAAATVGLVCAGREDPERQRVERYLRAWERGDHALMHAQLTGAPPVLEFARAHRAAAALATAGRLRAGKPREAAPGVWRVPVRVSTRIFGRFRSLVELRVGGEGDEARIAWGRELVFPGLRRGEQLRRETRLPQRADLLARDNTPLAAGPDRGSPLGAVAAAATGTLGAIPRERAERLRSLGVPDDAQVGASGLELIFDERLLGTPGGDLRAGSRLLARSEARKAPPLRTSLDRRVQSATVEALAGRLGGIVALRPRTGEILGFAGIAFSGLQPPGSTFKIITLAGALEAGAAKPSDSFPVTTSATLSGVELQNANRESCGGSLTNSFAHSCNSVFGPMGVKLGGERLVAMAERFGFNRPAGVPGAAVSTIPQAVEIGDDLALGSTAIGQGRVQATALQMARIAAAIGRRGRMPRLTLEVTGAEAPSTPVVKPLTARRVERMMLEVVRRGTGRAAAVQGVRIAGKTGTAELRSTQACEPQEGNPETCPPEQQADPTDTDAWFAAYAPAGDGRPRAAVAVMLVGAGAGGDTAAPAARQVLLAALR